MQRFAERKPASQLDSFNRWVTAQGNYSWETLCSEGTNTGLEGSWLILRSSIAVKSNTDPIPHCSFLSRHVPVMHALTEMPSPDPKHGAD